MRILGLAVCAVALAAACGGSSDGGLFGEGSGGTDSSAGAAGSSAGAGGDGASSSDASAGSGNQANASGAGGDPAGGASGQPAGGVGGEPIGGGSGDASSGASGDAAGGSSGDSSGGAAGDPAGGAAGVAASGGAGGTPPVPDGVQCGSEVCPPGGTEICCSRGLPFPSMGCATPSSCFTGLPIACDGPEDCPGDAECCGNLRDFPPGSGYTGVSCMGPTEAGCDVLVCDPMHPSLCPPPTTCQDSGSLPNPIYVCRE